MKTIATYVSNITSCLLIMTLIICCKPADAAEVVTNPEKATKDQTIMLALLLDTSNSMDGLIEQAKSQLWKVVNDLAAAKCDDGNRPNIKIALYEYGNDRLPESEGYIRQVSGLTDDLDLISEKLFALSTNGGNEFCGYVIKTSLAQLAWSSSRADLKMIFIAGNEPFNQGGVPFQVACSLAKEKDVIINTIFCGDFKEGLNTNWKRGSDLTGGSYMSIEQNQKTVYIPTPYDDQIETLNDKLNDTYVYYGKKGVAKKEQQLLQDQNAVSYGKSNKVERTVSKSSHAYSNSGWDLVDASKNDEKVISQATEEELPAEMKSMTVDQRKTYVKTKSDERKKIQGEIQSLNKQRQQYLAAHASETNASGMLDEAMIKAIRQQAKQKKLSWQ
jgi:hypothetical protein